MAQTATSEKALSFNEEKLDEKVETIEQVPLSRSQKYYEASTEDEKNLDRSLDLKLDFFVVSLLALNFLLCGIDKTNIGNAATTTFVKDAHLKPNDVSNAVSLLSVTFVTLQPFSTILGRRFGPKYWIPFLMVCWGSICMAHAGIKSRETLIALRLLLGAAEAGFVPTTFYYLSTIYPHYMLGFRLGLFAGMYSIAGAFAGLIAYGVFQIQSITLKGWQILFLLEGGLTLLMAMISILVLPARLGTAWFLSPAERAHGVHRMQVDLLNDPEIDVEGNYIEESRKVTWRDVRDAFKDWKKILTIVFNILATLPVSAFGTFLPLVVKGMGYSGVKANLMSVSPFVVGAFGLFLFVYSSDRQKERSIHTVISMFLALIGLLVMILSSNPKLRYGFTHICLAGAFTAGPLIVAWLAGNTPDKGTRSIIIGMNGYSNIAGVIAGQLFKSSYAPSYHFSLVVTMILIAIGMLGFLMMRGVYMWENRWRARKIRDWSEEQLDEERRSLVRRGDQRWTFVYGL